MSKKIIINHRKIGPGNPCFIVAEMSGNHKHDINRAYKIIDKAAEAGVDAIKLQTYTPDTLTINSNERWFRIESGEWKDQTLYQLYQKAYTPWEWQPELKKYAENKGLICFSTPFDTTAVDFLEKMNVQIYKVASFENIDLKLLERIGQTKKPVIISRGLASLSDLRLAIKTLKKSGTSQIAILHCISSYPATLEQMNIATMQNIREKLKVIVGLSDHSLGIIASIAAVALGAKIIEKHFTLSRAEGGPDASFSLEPKEMQQLVKHIRDVEKVIGKVRYAPDKKETENIIFRRSLFVIVDVKKGEEFSNLNVRCIRPGYGLSPIFLDKILRKRAKKDIKAGTPITWDLVK